MTTTSSVKPPWAISDRILCTDSWDLLRLRDAKILAITEVDGERKYKIRYRGWTPRFEEWVSEERISKFDADRMNKSEKAAKAAKTKNGIKAPNASGKTPETDEQEDDLILAEWRAKVAVARHLAVGRPIGGKRESSTLEKSPNTQRKRGRPRKDSGNTSKSASRDSQAPHQVPEQAVREFLSHRRLRSPTFGKNSNSSSKDDGQGNNSANESSGSSQRSPSPQVQPKTSQYGLPPLPDVSIVLERHPSIERQIASSSPVQEAARHCVAIRPESSTSNSSTSNSSSRSRQSNGSHRSTPIENSTNAQPPRHPQIESVFSINREDNNAVDAHLQCNEKQRATEIQLHETKDKYIAALELNGQYVNRVLEMEVQIAALSQRNQVLEAMVTASTEPAEAMDVKDELPE